MKAITCPQCGSLIGNFPPHQFITSCDYCGAKVMIDNQFSVSRMLDAEVTKFRSLEIPAHSQEPIQSIFIAISGIGIFTFLLIVVACFAQ